MSPILALLVGAVFVIGAISLGVSAIIGEQKQRQRFHDRVGVVAASYVRVNPLAEMGRAQATRSRGMTRIIGAAAKLVGFNPAFAEHYALPWWVVLSVALVLSRAIAEVVGLVAGSWALMSMPMTWVMLSRYAFHWSERRRRETLYAQFPDALAMIVRAVRVGIPLAEGIHTVAREALAPTGPVFAQLYDRVGIGVTLEDALHEMAGRNQLPEYRFFATALALQSRTGGGLS